MSHSTLLIIYGGLYVFLLLYAWRTIRRSSRQFPDIRYWREMPAMIGAITRADIDDTQVDEAIKSVLRQVLTDEPGHGEVDRIPAAMQPVEVAVDDHIRSYKESAANFVLATLVVTAVTLAIVFGTGDGLTDRQSIMDHFYTIFLANGGALLIALLFQMGYLRTKSTGADVLRIAYSSLGSLQAPLARDVDPNLAAALTHVAREMEKLSERQEQRNLEKIQGLTNEVRTLATSIKDLFKEVVAQREDDSPDQTAVVLTRAVQSSMEQLTARFDTAAAGLTDAVNQGIPVANALEEASHAMSQHLDSFLAADLSGAVDRLQRSIDQNSEKVDKRDAEILEGLSAQASATSEQFQQVRDELLNNRQAIQDLPGQLAPTITSGILESQKEIPERVANAVGSRLEQSFGTSISSFADASMAARAEDAQRVSELLRKASEASELLKQIEQKLGSNGHGPALAQTIEKLDGTIERLEGALSSGTGNHGGLRGLLRRR